MAKTKQDLKKGLTWEHKHKIWKSISIDDWLKFFYTHKEGLGFQRYTDVTLKGKCPHPEHNETSPSFYLHTDKGYGYCYGCLRYEANPITIFSWIAGVSYGEALSLLIEKYKFNFLPKKILAEIEVQQLNQLTKTKIYNIAHTYMLDALAGVIPDNLAKPALDWLLNTRKIPQDALGALPVGIMPPLDEITDKLSKDYANELRKWQTNPLTEKPIDTADAAHKHLSLYFRNAKYSGSIVWPLYKDPQNISRLKMRVPHNLNPKEIIMPEDDYEDVVGLYGLNFELYQNYFGDRTPGRRIVYLVEGELDAMTPMAQFVLKGQALFPIISVGGLGTAQHIEPILKSTGINTAYFIGDSPSKGKSGGDVVIKHWLKYFTNLRTRIFNQWDQLAPAGDIDEAVNTSGIGMAKVEELLYKKPDSSFVATWQWAYDQVEPLLKSLPEDDVRSVIEYAAEEGSYVNNLKECEAYVDKICVNFPLAKREPLLQEITSKAENETGFINRCTNALSRILLIIGTEISGNTRFLVGFDKQHQRFHRIKLDNEQSVTQELAPITGTLINFVEERVGWPAFLESPYDSDGMGLKKLDVSLRFFMKEAVNMITKGAPDIQSSDILCQGYHCIEDLDGSFTEYIVCGSNVFKLNRTNTRVVYEKLEGPRDGNIVFDVGLISKISQPWYPGGFTSDLLDKGNDVDLQQLYKDLVTFYDTGFTFKHQVITTKLLAAFVMMYPIMDCLIHPSLLFITGDTESGKSTLLSTLSDIGNSDLRLLYASHGWESYSEPIIASEIDRDSRLTILDEFESDSPKRGETVRALLELFRPLITGPSKRIRKYNNERQEKIIICPVIFAAITGAEKAQDLNRLLLIEMQKISGKNNPTIAIKGKIGQKKIKEMARDLTIGMYPHVPNLRITYEEIKNSYTELSELVPFTVSYRYASSLFPALTLMKYLGLDWKEFYKSFALQNKSIITRATYVSESQQFLNTMLRNPVIENPQTKQKISVGQLLANTETRSIINDSACGVYFDEETSSLVFLLEQALLRLMPLSHIQYNGMTVNRLKEALTRHTLALSEDEIPSTGIMSRIGRYLGAGIRMSDVVVFRADSLLSSVDQTLQERQEREEKFINKMDKPPEPKEIPKGEIADAQHTYFSEAEVPD